MVAVATAPPAAARPVRVLWEAARQVLAVAGPASEADPLAQAADPLGSEADPMAQAADRQGPADGLPAQARAPTAVVAGRLAPAERPVLRCATATGVVEYPGTTRSDA